MARSRVKHPSLEERRARGRTGRELVPRSSHAGWEPASDRSDPVALLEQQNVTREPDLVPVRHGRMMVSPFTFYRGAAKVMAADLAHTPNAGLTVQLCGDAHLSNFGAFGSPERNLVFDVNDFDETLPGPFEYDVKRLAASITIAGRNNEFSKSDTRAATTASVETYRTAMARFAAMSTMDVWYTHVSEQDIVNATDAAAQSASGAEGREMRRRIRIAAAKAHTRDSLHALAKLAEPSDGRYRIVSQPPIIVPVRDVQEAFGLDADVIEQVLHDQFRDYRRTLQDDRKHLLERFELIDLARKVVGVGSVGTRAYILLLQGRDSGDPLFLQVKEATASVLEDALPKSRYHQPGERVVQGQRLMQSVSDIFLGWTKGIEEGRFLYWRQLRDMKGSADVESMSASGLLLYARLCGFTLARAHARSGDPVVVSSYLGKKDAFDKAITDFATRYADQNELDYEQFLAAIESGRLEARPGL